MALARDEVADRCDQRRAVALDASRRHIGAEVDDTRVARPLLDAELLDPAAVGHDQTRCAQHALDRLDPAGHPRARPQHVAAVH
jgi:hypothetical protein